MNKLVSVIGKKEFVGLAFFLFLMIFSWPLITTYDLENSSTAFWSIFIIWGVMIGVLFLMSLHYREAPAPEPAEEDKE